MLPSNISSTLTVVTPTSGKYTFLLFKPLRFSSTSFFERFGLLIFMQIQNKCNLTKYFLWNFFKKNAWCGHDWCQVSKLMPTLFSLLPIISLSLRRSSSSSGYHRFQFHFRRNSSALSFKTASSSPLSRDYVDTTKRTPRPAGILHAGVRGWRRFHCQTSANIHPL